MDSNIVATMQAMVNGALENDLNVSIAEYILKNLHSIQNMTISDLAFETFTSTASISRFARSLGCKNFNEMKKGLEPPKGMDSRRMHPDPKGMFMDFTKKDPFANYIDRIIQSLKDMEEKLSMDDVDALVKAIRETENVYFYAMSIPNLLAQNLQSNLLYAGKFVYSYDSGKSQLEAARTCPEDSLAVVFSMNGTFMEQNKAIMDALITRKIRMILVTQEASKVDAKNYDRIISLGQSTDTVVGRYKTELFMEILVNRYLYNYCGRDILEALDKTK